MFIRIIDRLKPHCSARKGLLCCLLVLLMLGLQPGHTQDVWAISQRPGLAPDRKVPTAIDKLKFVGQQTPALPNPQNDTTLEPDKPIERELTGDQKHRYQITLAEGQYAGVLVEQRGLDVVVQLIAADGKSIVDFDREMRSSGAEKVGVVAEAAGSYHLLVKAKYPGAPGGRYEIRIIEARPATEQDRLLIEARKLETVSRQLWGAGKYTDAHPLAERALELQERVLGAAHPDLPFPLLNFAAVNYFKGDYAKAEELCQRALETAEKALGSEHPMVAQSLYNLANVINAKGDLARAESLFQRAASIGEKALGPDHPLVATSLVNLAYIYGGKGEFVRAIPLLERALLIQEKILGRDHPTVANSVARLASLYRNMGDYNKALALSQRDVAIWEKTNHPFLGNALNNLANLYTDVGDYDRAEPLYLRAISIQEKAAPGDPVLAVYRGSLAVLYKGRGDYAKAEPLYLSSLATFEKALGPNHPRVAEMLQGLGRLYLLKGDFAKAEPLYQRAKSILETALGPDFHIIADILNDLAKISAADGKLAEAVAYQARANAIVEHNLALNLALGSEREKQDYLASLPEQMSQAISLHVSFAVDDPAARELAATTVLQRKGRVQDALSNILASLRSRSSAEDQAFFDQLNEITSQLARLALNLPQGAIPAEYQKRIKALEEKREEIESEISRRSSGFYQASQTATLAGVRAAIPSDAALIEFAVYHPLDLKAKDQKAVFDQPRYVVYVIRNQGDVRWAELGTAKEIDTRVDALRQALRDPKRKDVERLARAVDEKVMQPVRALIGDARQILISPDGELNLIPFAALVDEQGHYLLERYSFNYLTSGRDLLRLQVRRDSKGAPVVVADPAFGEPALVAARGNAGSSVDGSERAQLDYSQIFFGPLPGVGDEVRSLKQLLPQAAFLTKEQATKAALLHVRGPSILHVATHGFFLENGQPESKPATTAIKDQTRLGKWVAHVENPLLRSGLALAGANQASSGNNDGVLTAFEATGLDLWGTKLVVLSACDTGVGEVKNGEGVYGLRRALVLAGSESQMMSLWAVSDHSTRDLIVGYYTTLLQGAGRSEALRQVQLRMLHEKSRHHPYYWAGFILSGQWAKL